MPIYIPPISRRRFIASGLAAATGVLLNNRYGFADAPKVDPNRFAILSDTHIAADPKAANKDAVMAENLRRVVAEVAALAPLPAAVLINGDCAYNHGNPADYALFIELLRPIRQAGIPIHLTLGNHDHRANILAAVKETIAEIGLPKPPVEDRHVTIVKSPHGRWYLLDTLDQTNHTPGLTGEKQLAWLNASLEETLTDDTPVLVMTHHDPAEKSLLDSKALTELLVPHHNVKAHLFGHTHNWKSVTREDDINGPIHLLNLPPTAYVFTPGRPNGWVDCRLDEKGATFELRCLDPKHASHGQKIEYTWRCGC